METKYNEILKILLSEDGAGRWLYTPCRDYPRQFSTYEEAQEYALEDIKNRIKICKRNLSLIAWGEMSFTEYRGALEYSQMRVPLIDFILAEALQVFA